MGDGEEEERSLENIPYEDLKSWLEGAKSRAKMLKEDHERRERRNSDAVLNEIYMAIGTNSNEMAEAVIEAQERVEEIQEEIKTRNRLARSPIWNKDKERRYNKMFEDGDMKIYSEELQALRKLTGYAKENYEEIDGFSRDDALMANEIYLALEDEF